MEKNTTNPTGLQNEVYTDVPRGTWEVECIEYKDVRGKELLYLRIKRNGKEVLINVGDKTFKSVKELK